MVKIKVQEDCGNAPKKELIRDFEIAFAKGEENFILESISDDVVWDLVGDKVICGREETKEALKSMLDGTMVELTIENIMTHGDVGAANGVMKFKDGTTFGFCDVFKFSSHAKNATLKKITAYIVEI